MINKKEYELLLHDIKRISYAIKIVVDEENKEKRKVIGDLLISECDRLFEDLEESKNK